MFLFHFCILVWNNNEFCPNAADISGRIQCWKNINRLPIIQRPSTDETALVGSSQLSMIFMFGPLVGSLIDLFGMRKVSFAGGFLYSVGLISASYVNSIYGLFPTFSLIVSLASALLYSSTQITPVKCISSKYQGIACSFVSSGGYTGTLSLSLLITFLLEQFRWKVTFRILAYLGVVICVLSLTYGWIEEDGDISNRNRIPSCNWSLCKRPRYFVFMFGSGVAMFGWQVGNFFLADRAKAYGIHENQSKWFYFVFGIFGITFGLIAGKIGDMIRYRVILNISCLFLHGINTLFSYLCKTYSTLLIYSAFSGIFFGIYNSTLCLSVLDCVGAPNIAQGFGFLVFYQGFAIFLGPPLAGFLRDTTGTFKLPLIIAGCLEMLGALISLPVAGVNRDDNLSSCLNSESRENGDLTSV
ncbi:monocarboxylate transporter 10-like isoform X2 [Dendronephthya gigantea]|uniref:monocarboxylate transporter 10-like isoform X2 n=1 Tax=Dendronephthya gigantea TaxID=151771 RepID=UPI00106CE3BB|nr:monocarboxylate transporter 10-like isoform X2 [Dendronephthya gigantea]